MIPEPLKKAWLLVCPRLGTFDSQVFDVNPLLNPEFAKRTNLKERLQELSLNYLYITRTAREEALNHLYSGVLPRGLGGHELTAGAIGLESRHPIADKRLVEFCLALPQEQKIFRGWSKMVLRRAMTGTLPEEVRWRPDRNNEGTSFYEALLSSRQENSYQEIWDNPRVPQDYMDAAALNHVWQRYKEQGMASDAFILWRISHLAKWLGNLS